MIKIESNAAAFSAQLAAAIAALDEQLNFAFQRWSYRIFYDLVVNTPQWSGDTASNWRFSIGSPSAEYHEIPDKSSMWPLPAEFKDASADPYHRGSYLAVSRALDEAKNGPLPRWTDKVFFTNNTPIAPDLETNSVYIRPVNLVGGAVAMVSYTVNKWKNLPA